MFKKQTFFALLFGAGAFVFLFSGVAQAQDLGLQQISDAGLVTATTLTFTDILIRVINALFGLLGTVAVALFMYAGWIYMTAGAEAAKIEQSKTLMKNAAIGMAIILSAAAIVNFLFYLITGRTPWSRGGVPGYDGSDSSYEAGTGALGGGIIESHYPKRNATGVARNVALAITFKEEVRVDQIINVAPTESCAVTGAIKPYTTTAATAGVFALHHRDDTAFDNATISDFNLVTDVQVSTNDCKTFVFRPSPNFLGTTDHDVLYTMGITNALTKKNGQSAFGNLAADGEFAYKWNFTVSTKLDVTPPTVTSVIPIPVLTANIEDPANLIPRNYMIQVNFSEPVNPLTISGVTSVNGNTTTGFTSLLVGYDATNAGGTWQHGNEYQTTEFVTNDMCGTNSCNQSIFCLPANKALSVLVQSPALASPAIQGLPFATNLLGLNGVVDMAYNALDGNSNSQADGPGDYATAFNLNSNTGTKDAVTWKFKTSGVIDLVPPLVSSYSPSANEVGVDPTATMIATFNKLLSATSIKPDSNYGDGFCSCTTNSDCNSGESCSAAKGYCVNSASAARVACYNYLPATCKLTGRSDGKTKIDEVCKQQEHATLDQTKAVTNMKDATWYAPNSTNVLVASGNYTVAKVNHGKLLLNKDYGVRYGSGIKDITQNCYTPNAAPGCVRSAINPLVPDTGYWSNSEPGTCDLTASDLATRENISVSYTTPQSVNQIQDISMYSWTRDVNTIFEQGDNVLSPMFNFLSEIVTPNTLGLSLYATGGDVYLVGYSNAAVISGSLTQPAVSTDTVLAVSGLQNFPQPLASQSIPIIVNGDEAEYKAIEGSTLAQVSGLGGVETYPLGSPVRVKSVGSFSVQSGATSQAVAFDTTTNDGAVQGFVMNLGPLTPKTLNIRFTGLANTGLKARFIAPNKIMDLKPDSQITITIK